MQILSMVISSAVAIGGLCILAASVFGLLDHGQKRAARRLSYLAAGYLIFWTVIIAVVVPHFWSVGIILSLPFLAVGVILCKPNSLGRQGPLPSPEPYDKRDTPFSRIRLKPGTAEYEEYYAQYPEKQKFDDQLRNMSGIGSPDSPTYQPEPAALMRACFSSLGRIGRLMTETYSISNLSVSDPTAAVKNAAQQLGAVSAGVTRLDPGDIYLGANDSDEIDPERDFAVIFAVEMDHEIVDEAPKLRSSTESARGYLQAAVVALTLVDFIRRMGFSARAHISGDYLAVMPPLAARAGLGEIGRSGLLVTEQYGSRVRLAAVTTDLPLYPDSPRSFGLQQFCKKCSHCAYFCPGKAINKSSTPKKHRGVRKWTVNPDRCYRQWRKMGTDCGICLKVCPFSQPDTLFYNLMRRAVRRRPSAIGAALKLYEFLHRPKPKRS